MILQRQSKMLEKSIVINKPKKIEVFVTSKKIKRMILKYKDGQYHLSKPIHVSMPVAISWLESLSIEQFERLKKVHKVKMNNEFVYLFGHKYAIKELGIKNMDLFLKKQLQNYAIKRIKELNIVNFDVKVEVQNMKSKYGCCFYTQQRIKLSTRLVHEPKEVIDSILIHELAHFYYPNHQKEFYRFVYEHCPNYKACEKYLKLGGVGFDPISE